MLNTSSKPTTNEVLSHDPWIPLHVGRSGYLTKIDENPRKQNEFDSSTEKEDPIRFDIILSIATDSIEELDLAPELSLSEAATLTRKFINELPEDLVDVDLGPGI